MGKPSFQIKIFDDLFDNVKKYEERKYEQEEQQKNDEKVELMEDLTSQNASI